MFFLLFIMFIVVPFVLFMVALAESNMNVGNAVIYLIPVVSLAVLGVFSWFYRQAKKRRKSEPIKNLSTPA